MKNFNLQMIIIIIITFGFIQTSKAQTHSNGLYLTYNDYVNHKLSYTSNPSDPNGNKIMTHEFMEGRNVTVISNGKKIVLPKSEVFGYRDSNNNDYRFFENKAYQVVDTAGFCFYSGYKLVQQGKGPKPTKVYYFSKKTNDEILPVTTENIAKAFPENPKFRYMVEVASSADGKLTTYDAQLNEYKIKELYTESLK